MQLTPVKELREGQAVAREVRDGQGRILLARGQRLTASLIQRLFKFRVASVYLRDGFGESEPELVGAELRQKCAEVLSASFRSLGLLAEAKKLKLDAAAIVRASDDLITALMSNRNPLISLLDINAGSDALMQHSVSAATLAITLALDLGVTPDMLNHLGTAMLFHDIGMIFLPEPLLARTPPLSPAETAALRSHVRIGAQHLLQAGAVSSIAASLILRHHEAMDGSGYPDGIGGDKLSLLARIACAAEAYDSMTTPRPYAPALMPDAAITYMLSQAGKLFAKEVVVALCRRVALYPAGTAVQLNTGERGVVVGTLPELPMRPSIQVHFDHKGRRLPTPARIDLAREGTRFVTRSAPNLSLLDTNQCRQIRPQAVLPAHTLG